MSMIPRRGEGGLGQQVGQFVQLGNGPVEGFRPVVVKPEVGPLHLAPLAFEGVHLGNQFSVMPLADVLTPDAPAFTL
jgi:hypothetical protein